MQYNQAKYAVGRIDEIESEKLKVLRDEYKIDPLSIEKKLVLIRKGRVAFHEKFVDEMEKQHKYNKNYDKRHPNYTYRSRDYNPSFYLDKIWDFSEHETVNTSGYADGYEEAVALLTKQVSAIKDEIWLGDEEKAANLIQQFQNS